MVPGAATSAPRQGEKPLRKARAAKPAAPVREEEADNTIDLAKDGAAVRKRAAGRRKRRRRLQAVFLIAVFLSVLFLYFSGIYRTAVLKATDVVEGIRISLQGSGSFPLAFELPGYVQSEGLAGNGVAVLGEKDLVVVSGTGRELYRLQHGFGNPHISAGDTRVCLYNRGGTELTIEGRGGRILSRTTERDILFAEMSPGGALALATTSRFRSVVQIFSNFSDNDPQFSWEITDEKPYAAAFLKDNKHLALACVSTQGGSIHSNIYLLHSNRTEVQATINGGSATVLDIQYLSQSRVLVLYDSYAALYNAEGEQLARYDYAGREIAALHSNGGTTALAFNAVSNNRVTVEVLDAELQVTASLAAVTAEAPRVLVENGILYLLTGYDVAAYDAGGTLLNRYTADYKGYDLAAGGVPMLITAGNILNLDWMADPEATGPESETAFLSSSMEGSSAASLDAEGPTSQGAEGTGEENEAPKGPDSGGLPGSTADTENGGSPQDAGSQPEQLDDPDTDSSQADQA